MSELNQPIPFSEVSERAVIGGIILDCIRAKAILSEYKVTEDWFYIPIHRTLWQVIDQMPPDGIDIVTLQDTITNQGIPLDDSLDVFVDACMTVANLRFYVEQMKDAYIRRLLLQLAGEIRIDAVNPDQSGLVSLSKAITTSIQSQSALSANTIRDARTVYQEILAEIEARRNGSSRGGIPCFIPSLNALLGGFQGICVIAARPGAGKSSFLGNALSWLASREYAVSLASHEMTEDQFRTRTMCGEAGVPPFAAQMGRMTNEQFAKITEEADRQSNWKFRICDSSMTIDQVCGWMAAEVQVYGAQILAIDYLQIIMSSHKGRDSRAQEIANWMNMLRETQKRLKVPLLLLSQMSREYEKEGRKPRLSDLRESGAIEQDASQVMFLHGQDADTVGIVAKNRYGPTGERKIVFNKSLCMFSELAEVSEANTPDWAREQP